ncbi:MAG TPA: tetratricopeptide repeat protein [Kiritimatiellia bacterium]|nr:tetratricopeptide repeat protein [Kiritimatiellia bacterium]HRZ10842.1 tetratricopeptide repeat protein [Kiritimatiellia bacterium]HSA18885.1 tetratricopeptide repeat protein [Kiritimatiellia bacterium]
MEPTGDIYQKADRPYHVSRRSRFLLRHGRMPSASQSPPAAGADPATPGEAPPAGPAPSSHYGRRRRKSGSRRFHWRYFLSSRLNSALIAFSLVVGGLMLLVVLTNFMKYRIQIQREAREADAPPATPPPASSNAIPSDLGARIAAWRQMPDRLAEVEGLRQKSLAGEAEQRLEQALKDYPSAVAVRLTLARVLADAGRPAEAVVQLREALDAQPADPEARLLLGAALGKLGEYDLCRQVAEWMVETDPYSMEAHRLAATSYLKTDQPRAAIPHLRKIVNIEFDNLDVQSELADALSRAGEHDKALATLEGVLNEDPANAMALFTRAVCYVRQNRTDEACETLRRAAGHVGTDAMADWMGRPEWELLRELPWDSAEPPALTPDGATGE